MIAGQTTFTQIYEQTPEEIYTQQVETARLTQKALEQIRRVAEQLNGALSQEKYTVHSPGDAAQLVLYDMSAEPREVLKVMSLDTRNNVKAIDLIYQGALDSSTVRVCELFRVAILHNAKSIIVLHNHPSGDPSPSPDDIAVTRAIAQAGKVLDIDVLDHLIIAGGRFVSLKERGLGFS